VQQRDRRRHREQQPGDVPRARPVGLVDVRAPQTHGAEKVRLAAGAQVEIESNTKRSLWYLKSKHSNQALSKRVSARTSQFSREPQMAVAKF